jgi:hypothetical protein
MGDLLQGDVLGKMAFDVVQCCSDPVNVIHGSIYSCPYVPA